MLILTRKRGESIYIGGRIKVTVVDLKPNQVRIGIDAPQEERVYREEIYIQILEENQRAASSSATPDMSSIPVMAKPLRSSASKLAATPIIKKKKEEGGGDD